jgi:uncharacterized protein YjbI with pentapeptide repeats
MEEKMLKGEPQGVVCDQSKHRKISQKQLKKILDEHQKWLESKGKEGAKADLSLANLCSIKLRQVDLTGGNLQEVDLSHAKIENTVLNEAVIEKANLHGARFRKVFLLRTNLRQAILMEAKLEEVSLIGADLQEANVVVADLQGANLAYADLQKAALWSTNLQGAFLPNAKLQKAELRQAKLRMANLSEANLKGADLSDTDLREAELQDADLTGVKGLQGEQLAGATVSGAKLPEDIRKFEEGLKVVEEASRNARKLFFAMLSACAYALLTIATTTDVLLLTNSRSSPLPIIRTEIPIVWFYIATPLILLGLYFYFHLYMQRLWEGLAELPAIFPDGRSLDKKAYPWLLIGLVRAHVFHLKKSRPPLSRLQEWISVALGWWFMPATLICFWLRYIPRQDWFGTGFHIALLVVAVWAGVLFYRLGVGTLRWDEIELSLWKKPFKKITTYKRGVLPVRLGLVVLLLSLGTINGVRGADVVGTVKFQFNDGKTWVPYVLERIGFNPFANFREKDVSTKPPNWSGREEEIPLVRGAPLEGRNLRCVQAYNAFLVNADLRNTDLRRAFLAGANLQGANLKEANLQKAVLTWANLQKAKLWRANLQKASLKGAHLEEAKLGGANLQGAWLVGADVQKAQLSGANLQEAKLWGANLQEADLRYTNLQKADLRAANLEEAKLEGSNLAGAIFLKATNLDIEQLSKVKTLYEVVLDPEFMDQTKAKYPHLLEKPKED